MAFNSFAMRIMIMVLNYGQKLCEGNAQEIQNNKQVQEAYFGKRAGLGGTEG